MTDRRSRELQLFHELARVVAEEPFDVGRILERVCGDLRSEFGFTRALVARLNEGDRTVHAVIQQGFDWPGDQWLLLDRFPFLVQALETGRAAFVRDALTERAMPGKIAAQFEVRSIVAIPLTLPQACFGFLVGDRAGAGFELSAPDLDLLTALGRVAAVFVSKADEYTRLERAVEELRRIDAVKRDFISIASHELRTPIAVVHGITSTLHLRGEHLRPDQLVELRATLYEQSSRLTSLVEQLLDLSRLEVGAVHGEAERFRPRERIDTLLTRLVPDRVDDLRVEVDPSLELETDPAALERVVANLIVNALSYGLPPVCVRACLDGGVRLIVEDCGKGVDPEFVPDLFERFSRGATSRRATTGAGLGLAIARSYAQELGGDLAYEPAAPGARFTLTLPSAALVA
ncbi:MAG: GAF domain-containing protein [Actinobacteria bacterium]|nr:GAF domain-containing protein [Actinomycetota bacterium]